MINEERVKQMTQMAIYEEGKGRSDVPMTQYFRHDYIGKEMVKSILTGTIAFALLCAMYLLYQLEYFMENINQIDVLTFGTGILIKYIIFIAVYLFITYVVYGVRYTVGRKHIKIFYAHLKKVNKLYEQEEKRKLSDEGQSRNKA
ncbi:MAG: hypothetical protein UHU19_19070 [Lachnospiraceae bacterium]|nr:hypothetical protein [Lachnospiraceae bacterium]